MVEATPIARSSDSIGLIRRPDTGQCIVPSIASGRAECKVRGLSFVDQSLLVCSPKLVQPKWESLGRVVTEGLMRKRRTADQVAQVLREVDRDLAKGLTIADVCRKIGVGPDHLLPLATAT